LATGTRSGVVKICDLESQKGRQEFIKIIRKFDLSSVIHPGGHKTCIRSIEYFPSSNNILATGAIDGTVKVCSTHLNFIVQTSFFFLEVWDPKRQGFIFNCQGHNGAINALKFSPDGRYLLTASDDAAIQVNEFELIYSN
jgi:katanin p80 WD40 repeat-containing subunit B1